MHVSIPLIDLRIVRPEVVKHTRLGGIKAGKHCLKKIEKKNTKLKNRRNSSEI